MTRADWLTLLQAALQGGLPAVVVAIVGRILHLGQKDIKAAQVEMHVSMNSRMDEALEAKRALGEAEGLARGLQQGRDEGRK